MPTIYTCITNQKDTLPPIVPEDGYSYVCFSDRPFKHAVWQYWPIHAQGQQDARRIARRYKLLSHIYFPGEDTIWIDGRVRLNNRPSYYFRKYTGNLAIRRHHARDCIYAEAEEVLRLGFDDEWSVTAATSYTQYHDYPTGAGLHETGVLLRRYCPEVVRFNEAWWALISAFTKRDQVTCDFVASRLGIKIQDIDRSEVTVLGHQRRTTKKT